MAVGGFLLVVAAAVYFYSDRSPIGLPTENLAAVKNGGSDPVSTTTAQEPVVDDVNVAISIKDRTLKKDGFTIAVPAGWAETQYGSGTTVVANPSEHNFDPVLQKSGFKSYYSVTKEKAGEKTWEQSVAYVKSIINASAPNIKYILEKQSKINGMEAVLMEVDLTRPATGEAAGDAKFKVLVMVARGAGDALWIMTFNTGYDMWSVYAELAYKIINSFQVL